jgi:hypothetical protein
MRELPIADHVLTTTTTSMTMMTRNDDIIAIVSRVIISMHGVETVDSTLHSTRGSC